jgi:tripartite-type tricarboxylate transporter receptor subunit TctC
MFGSEKRRQSRGAAVAAAAFTLAGSALAQSYPTKPVTFLDNIPGGPVEAIKRAIFAKVKDNTGATFIYEGRGGGGGATGLQAVKNAAPDGYTFGMTYQSAINLNPLINLDLNIDPINDYIPVTNLFSFGNVWGAKVESPYKDLRDLVAAAKAKPESVKIGIFGAGNRFFIAQLEEKTGAKFLLIPYKSITDAMTATLGGQIDAHFDTGGSVLAQKGKLKVVNYGAAKQSPLFPGLPTSVELYGIDTGSWFGAIAPAKVADAQVQWVAREIIRAVKDPKIAQMIAEQGYVLEATTPAEFSKQLRAEVEANRILARKYPDIK